MKFPQALVYILSSVAGINTLFYLLSNSSSTTIASAKYVELNFKIPIHEKLFFEKNYSRSGIKIPITNIEDISKYQYCTTDNKTSSQSATADTSSSSMTSTAECTSWAPINQSDKKQTFLAEMALYYLTAQHNLNLLKAAQEKTSSTVVATTTAQSKPNCTTCTFKDCKDCAQCTTTEKDKKCCNDALTCLDTEGKKKFYNSITNLTSSYQDIYFAPVKAYIQLHEDIDAVFTTSGSSASSTSTTVSTVASTSDGNTKKHMTGFLVYAYIDYYYKVLEDQKNVTIYEPSQAADDNSKQYYTNFPLCLEYELDNSTKKIKVPGTSSSSDSTATKNLGTIYKSFKDKPGVYRDSLEKINSQVKELSELLNCVNIVHVDNKKFDQILNN